ncbi:hypothetical protein BX600DRAFT_46769 [Xylariales sp. PMI_506]|nr:hypothetical protein BX600DRAFT_46769 [Xylariales sp. PMI_506]
MAVPLNNMPEMPREQMIDRYLGGQDQPGVHYLLSLDSPVPTMEEKLRLLACEVGLYQQKIRQLDPEENRKSDSAIAMAIDGSRNFFEDVERTTLDAKSVAGAPKSQ